MKEKQVSKDFNDDQGGIQSSPSTIKQPAEGGVPKTGFNEAPSSDKGDFGPGPGIGNTRGGIR